jgi:anhydro-N-acetylmuramic acid kinase
MAEIYIGLMSGTSADSIDAALLDCGAPVPRLLAACSTPYPETLRRETLALLRTSGTEDSDPVDALGVLDAKLGRAFAGAALRLIEQAGVAPSAVRAIGSHGQTIRHRPDLVPPFTLQIGDPHVIAAQTGITTVADFRRRDIALGGQGAPLAPIFHQAVLTADGELRTVVNIGGIANITVLAETVSGFDTGPGNTLMDAWAEAHFGMACDQDGAQAAAGTVDQALLGRLLADPYFQKPPPKSTGPEAFNLAWLNRVLDQSGARLQPEHVQATLCELTAASIVDAVKRYAPAMQRLMICGGGAKNPHLMQRLADLAKPMAVRSTAAYGFDPDWMEAAAFAWLARETLAGRPGNLPEVTGAEHATVLGAVCPGQFNV